MSWPGRFLIRQVKNNRVKGRIRWSVKRKNYWPFRTRNWRATRSNCRSLMKREKSRFLFSDLSTALLHLRNRVRVIKNLRKVKARKKRR